MPVLKCSACMALVWLHCRFCLLVTLLTQVLTCVPTLLFFRLQTKFILQQKWRPLAHCAFLISIIFQSDCSAMVVLFRELFSPRVSIRRQQGKQVFYIHFCRCFSASFQIYFYT